MTAGARVAAHTLGPDGVAALVDAGVDSVEHGTGLSASLIAEMARRRTALVPTMPAGDTMGHVAARRGPARRVACSAASMVAPVAMPSSTTMAVRSRTSIFGRPDR